MEYLVTMTTSVPGGTPAQAVDDVRAREAAHTRELAAQGYVLRLWRPPLGPGEWRTLGLFAAGDDGELERVLASMPLRVWRTDEVAQLAADPDDPAPGTGPPVRPAGGEGAAEFLVTITPAVPEGTSPQDVADATAAQAQRAGELAGQGRLVRLWELPAGPGAPASIGPASIGLWQAGGDAQMEEILRSLPLHPYTTTRTTKLTPHPSDPAAPGSRPRH
jgi:muconolactone delta-isomerase